jgi:hypothetical protein
MAAASRYERLDAAKDSDTVRMSLLSAASSPDACEDRFSVPVT